MNIESFINIASIIKKLPLTGLDDKDDIRAEIAHYFSGALTVKYPDRFRRDAFLETCGVGYQPTDPVKPIVKLESHRHSINGGDVYYFDDRCIITIDKGMIIHSVHKVQDMDVYAKLIREYQR